jgi:type IV pilus assembly protein PilP
MRLDSMNAKRTEERGAHMSIRAAFLLGLGLALVLMTTGCAEDEITTAPTAADFEKDRAALASRKPAKAKAAREAANLAQATAVASAEAGEAEYAAAGQDYFYDPRNKRDPFRSYRFVGDSDAERNFGPLGDFELGQLELSAVIWDATNPRALILDPGGRSYIVREGSQIGKNSGQVIHIGDNLVLVKETYENFAGERTTKDVELRIRLSQGG